MAETTFHIGLPRTGTTYLQKRVFPDLSGVRFIGKLHDNSFLDTIEDLNGVKRASSILKMHMGRLRTEPDDAMFFIRSVFTSVIRMIRKANMEHDKELFQMSVLAMRECLQMARQRWPDEHILFSDESLLVSHSDFALKPLGDNSILLEQFARGGLLKDVSVSLVVRDPIDFLQASYYKQLQQRHHYKAKPVSFPHYLKIQTAIYLHYPPASRLFLAMSRRLVVHLRNYCGNVIVNRFEDLLKAPRPADLMLGRTVSAADNGFSADVENASFSKEDVNAFILSSPGVPKGITMQEYAASFPKLIKSNYLDKLLEDERWKG